MDDEFQKNCILAEYTEIRKEILQLNNQIFLVLTSIIGINFTIISWIFLRRLEDVSLIPLVLGSAILLIGNLIILNSNRLAHRLAYYQKYFIENKLKEIRWAHAYDQYRKFFQKDYSKYSIKIATAERIAESNTEILAILQVINGIIGFFVYCSDNAFYIFLCCVVLGAANCFFDRILTQYNEIENAIKSASKILKPRS